MKQNYAKIVGTDGRDRQVKGGVRVTCSTPPDLPGMALLDKDDKVIAWVNPDATWLIGFTEEETTKQ